VTNAFSDTKPVRLSPALPAREPDGAGLQDQQLPPENPLDAPLATGAAPLEEVSLAAAVEAHVSDEHEYGRLGRPLNRQSPFVVAFTASLGVAAALLIVVAAYSARHILILVGLGLFIAVGLDPVVSWLQRRSLPRGAAVLIVVLAALAFLAGVIALVVPVVTTQVSDLVDNLPHYERSLTSHSTFAGKLNTRYHLISRVQTYLNGNGHVLASGIVGVGRAVVSGVLSTLIVVVVSIYLLVDLPRVKRAIYQLTPRSRRARVVLLGDEMFAKVGGYVLGNVSVSVIAGVTTWVWMEIFGIPYPVLLAVLVAILDLVPLVGSTVGGVIVALVALTVSLPLAIATVAFYLVFRLLEDYLLTPRIMGATVEVPGLVTVVATLVGGALLGIVGALVAIPVAAAVKLVIREVTVPRLDEG
jgi:predicted PurR-regulated permease PerM